MADDKPESKARGGAAENQKTDKPDYRLRTVADQLGPDELRISDDFRLLMPDPEFHIMEAPLTPPAGQTCTCNSVCSCVPVNSCACDAVCRCDAVALYPTPTPTEQATPTLRPAPTAKPQPPSSGADDVPRSSPGGGGSRGGGSYCSIVSHYWRPN